MSKVIPLKLFLDIVPSSSVDITRALRECFREEFLSFRFVSKQKKTSNAVGMSSLIKKITQTAVINIVFKRIFMRT